MGEKGILLPLVEAVDFINKENGRNVGLGSFFFGFCDNAPDILNSGEDG